MALKERMFGFLGKLERALALVEAGKVHPVVGRPQVFVVESQEGRGHYLVDLEGETCTCPAWTSGKTRPCKHLLAVVVHLWREGQDRREAARPGERPVA
ncbi:MULTISPECIES: SWIM zinc finger family protein [Thermus]|jgi:uncharacterized Zn finger protein|uniref:SWIM-type domain-containing protein n=1 Tax=Thermus scotoductus TaxID=37636 RepID=A0A430R9A9_THESC|nr:MULTISPECIES: SWIM zinc finger family protein [Thermus]MCS6869605.1 SWIM zinc finger domain-containing protein [Thermus sp.]MCX7850170.1 SWIM zinc finger domain-containing protein [Thermus sp.]MDW8017183.1 SWIM zinc finger family protein [Thermus sp.]MDW8357649.1 SWIM zinc finger family protein [Thermus sp.]RTH03962.1 hypothetical protein CSW47_07575 [Thermus scotoductus]